MSRVTRFAGRDPGPSARIAGFMAHLRTNGFRLGVSETDTALSALDCVDCYEPAQARSALKAVCAGSEEEHAAFDALFDAYWFNGGRVRQKLESTAPSGPAKHSRSSREDNSRETSAAGRAHSPDSSGGDGAADREATGRLIASDFRSLARRDLRDLVSPADVRAAEIVARQLGKALRDRRSRRRRAARKGARIDFRRTIRHSLASGGEPLRLSRRRRPDRPVRITALCDVSGSMLLYARPFLAFLAGLMRADAHADAWLFHTRLVRITGALREEDPLRALDRTTLLADGFGGGSRIGASLDTFSRNHARRLVDGRTVVMILSDGYDSDAPEQVGEALARLRRRGCRILWLNPLKSWAGYEPVARGMAAALPHLDLFASAASLSDLAALEKELVRL